MNILLLSSRFPWPCFTGDRLRAAIWLAALEKHANVALIAPPGEIPHDAPRCRLFPIEPSPRNAITAAFRVMRGAPVHSLLTAPYDWRGAIERAQREMGDFDAAIVLMSRLDPWVRPHLPKGLRLLDAIDSLHHNMLERSREASPLLHGFWRWQAERVGRAEREAVTAYDRVLVVSPNDAEELDAIAISNGVAIQPLVPAPRTYDFGFWSCLGYFANADAATWLLDELWPAIRARKPDATLMLAGAAASPRILDADGHDGITVRSPVDDIAALARSIRVALLPVRYGTGQSNKVLEAAEAGCAIVATHTAMRGLPDLERAAMIANDAQPFADAAIAALRDPMTHGIELRAIVESAYPRQTTLDQLAATIIGAREAAA